MDRPPIDRPALRRKTDLAGVFMANNSKIVHLCVSCHGNPMKKRNLHVGKNHLITMKWVSWLAYGIWDCMTSSPSSHRAEEV